MNNEEGTPHVANEPARPGGLPPGGEVPAVRGGLPDPSEGARYVAEVLDPLALSTYQTLLTDPDPKIRRAAASDVQELVGRKGKSGPSVGGITFNLTQEKMNGLVGGLAKVLTGRRAEQEVVDVDV